MQASYPHGPPPHGKKGGFPVWAIIVLVAIVPVIGIVGMLFTMGVYGARRYIANSKSVEAMNVLTQIGKDVTAAYDSSQPHRLCRSATRPVPDSLAKVQGVRYQSTPADWQVDKAADAGFACMGFWMEVPQYFMYSYEASGNSFVATAMGDFDGDGIPSVFSIAGFVDPGGHLVVGPIAEKNRGE
jgi:hypothetical protein